MIIVDIETIPCQNEEIREQIFKNAKDNFKAPSTLTKAQAIKDLELGEDGKYKTLADLKVMWAEEMGPTLYAEKAEEEYRKTSFNGGLGEIVSIAWADLEGEIHLSNRSLKGSEAGVIDNFFRSVREMTNATPYFIGHNLTFDLKFIYQRACILEVERPFRIPHNGRHERDYFCTMTEWAGFNNKVSLDSLAGYLGIEGKGDMDGSKVWDYMQKGLHGEVGLYNKEDVKLTREVYKRL